MAVTFDTILSNYPSGHPCKNPDYPDQCAIKLGAALAASGVSFVSYKGLMAPQVAKTLGYAIRARELAEWLTKSPFPGCSKPREYTGKSFVNGINGSTGILYLKHYWHRGTDAPGAKSGDHIDLWNSDRMASSWWTYVRTQYPMPDRIGGAIDWTDFRGAKDVLFWSIK